MKGKTELLLLLIVRLCKVHIKQTRCISVQNFSNLPFPIVIFRTPSVTVILPVSFRNVHGHGAGV